MSFLKRPILVIGSKGMLGQMVVSYFTNKGFKVIPINERFEEETKWDFINAINQYDDGIIFNCVGRIKQKTENEKDLLWSNTILPLALVHHLKSTITIVHPSTDCVFDGLAGRPYAIHENTNAKDSYGWSKILGEEILLKRPNTFITRVSIIGPDKNTSAKGLLGWFLSNPHGSPLSGYTNHLWNGITTLEWCKQVETYAINENLLGKSCMMIQFGTKEWYSKYQLLLLFQKYYRTNFTIQPKLTETGVDRRLVPDIISKTLEEQLAELISFTS
ncbi:MAG: sugar nucleotide-binding protein [Bacteroidia bacterium]|nr:sugar nucleotide-binding protein [Bacteroidia bacterium]